jgi:hypothetical protein
VSDDSDIRVQLARIEGKQDVTNERLSNVQNDIVELRRVQGTHGDRLGLLEASENIRSGERKGIALSGRILWAAVGTIPGAVLAGAAMKLFGL